MARVGQLMRVARSLPYSLDHVNGMAARVEARDACSYPSASQLPRGTSDTCCIGPVPKETGDALPQPPIDVRKADSGNTAHPWFTALPAPRYREQAQKSGAGQPHRGGIGMPALVPGDVRIENTTFETTRINRGAGHCEREHGALIDERVVWAISRNQAIGTGVRTGTDDQAAEFQHVL
jgi:hypothetical protein